MDEAENYIDITVVRVDDEKDSMIVDESFGPLMPLLAVDNVEEAIRIANSVHSTPLGFYPFGSKAETTKSTFKSRSLKHISYCNFCVGQLISLQSCKPEMMFICKNEWISMLTVVFSVE